MIAPSANVRTIERLTLMPISAAASLSSETARMAVPARLRMHEQVEPGHHRQRGPDHEHVDPADPEEPDRDELVEDVHRGVRVHARAEEAARAVLEEERRADRADQRDQLGRVAQRAVRDPLHQQGDRGRDRRSPRGSSAPMLSTEAKAFALSTPACWRPVATKYPANAPTMKISPWAKLIMRRMP